MAGKKMRAASRLQRFKPYRNFLLATLATILVFFALSGDYGLINYYQMRSEERRLAAKIIRLRHEVDSLQTVIAKLENDLDYIEKVAREKYNMIREGETVYELVPAE
jgi:cell division protein FtsB